MSQKKDKIINFPVNEHELNGKNGQNKLDRIAFHFQSIMKELNLDLNDESLKDTPMRVAKMYLNELFIGLDNNKKPVITHFDNSFKYKGIILEKSINLTSICEHHFVPIIGKAHIAYYANDRIIGLSKLNRIVDYFSKRPQVQEKLTVQIVDYLKEILETEHIACIIEAQHLCVSMRGIKDQSSLTTTAEYSGKFKESLVKKELFNLLKN